MTDGILLLEDGTVFEGQYFGTEKKVSGEVVFYTGMTGYQEIINDATYYGQIVVMTFPVIGTCGMNIDDIQAESPGVKALVVREYSETVSNWRAVESLEEYMKRHEIAGIAGIDTRELAEIIRDKGRIKGIISPKDEINTEDIEVAGNAVITQVQDERPVDYVTAKSVRHYEGTGYRVVIIDYGVKDALIKFLIKRDCDIHVVPAHSSPQKIMSIEPDGVILSNGPGNPNEYTNEIEVIKEIFASVPVFGIGLGHQLLALANGAECFEMKSGHRGCNYPVIDLEKNNIYITTQNHGYCVKTESIDESIMEISHKSMNDNTAEGIKYKNTPSFSVQFQPEAFPGTNDTQYCIDNFISIIEKVKYRV